MLFIGFLDDVDNVEPQPRIGLRACVVPEFIEECLRLGDSVFSRTSFIHEDASLAERVARAWSMTIADTTTIRAGSSGPRVRPDWRRKHRALQKA
jgi:hypothetical protein